MIFLCFFWFLLLYFFAYKLAGKSELFSPLKFVAIKFALTNLPFILFIAFNRGSFVKNILLVCNVRLDDAFLKYTLIQTVAFISLCAGMILFKARKPLVSPRSGTYNYLNAKILAFAFFGIGFGAYAVFLNRIGGLGYLLHHMSQRIELQSGQYVLILLPFMVISCLLLLLCIKLKNRIADKIILLLFAIVTIIIFSSFGARKSAVLFVITFLVALHYTIGHLKFNRKTIAMGGVLLASLLFYLFIIPVLRESSGSDKSINQSLAANARARKVVYSTSYTYIDIFAANYFNSENAWYFKGFFAPVVVPFTKADKKQLPQIDQGVYFGSIIEFMKHFEPPMPRSELTKTSWPTENFGLAYANLLLPGIIIFFFLQGMVFSLVYRFMLADPKNAALQFLYVMVIFDFNFSSLRIAEFIRLIPVIAIAFILIHYFVGKYKTSKV
ncbi:hypothetical protein FMM05_08910 [Flavobacterium zepuense]|uniref:Oligosaccharide repeat unit polymerase n=1 Tax=Flavobacterium zepuense TaxID=2593302 RepID=A0A552V2D0_9FLAO|nr:hypothetical protein [Flavobacterium zepuense]TRW24623.1 hypothetical protein FMM05_08910 [Flavobacterium zepuense]